MVRIRAYSPARRLRYFSSPTRGRTIHINSICTAFSVSLPRCPPAHRLRYYGAPARGPGISGSMTFRGFAILGNLFQPLR